jgi:hypothetical protein
LPPALRAAVTTRLSGDANFPSVSFYEFSSVTAANNYYRHPGWNFAVNAAFMRPLAGPAPAGSSSRWIDLEQCLYFSGPNPNHAPIDAPASAMTGNGTCPIGTAVPDGLAAIAQRGRDVVVVNNPASTGGLASTIPTNVTQLPVAIAVQVAGLLRAGVKELQGARREGAFGPLRRARAESGSVMLEVSHFAGWLRPRSAYGTSFLSLRTASAMYMSSM